MFCFSEIVNNDRAKVTLDREPMGTKRKQSCTQTEHCYNNFVLFTLALLFCTFEQEMRLFSFNVAVETVVEKYGYFMTN